MNGSNRTRRASLSEKGSLLLTIYLASNIISGIANYRRLIVTVKGCRMIKQLSKFYDNAGEIVVPYDESQEELYKKAMKELVKESKSLGYKHHSYETEKLRAKIQSEYAEEGLKVDLISNNNSNWSNFAAMVVKRFLTRKGFHVLASSEDFNLILDRGTRYDSVGFSIICKIFGAKKVEELMRKAKRNGGEPDLFVYLDHSPNSAWFVEVKRKNEPLTSAQVENFPFIRDLLCPIEIARIVRLNEQRFPLSVECAESQARNMVKSRTKTTPAATHSGSKTVWYEVNGQQGSELPTFFLRCVYSLRERGTMDVTLRKDIHPEDKIFQFENHHRYQDYTKKYQVTSEEWQTIFTAVRSADTF